MTFREIYMIDGKKVLAIVPARGGSKGIKGKNIYPVNGKPLIWYTLSEAQKSKYIDRIIVSTDSREIADVAEQYGVSVPFLRPAELALDHSKSIDALISVIHTLEDQGETYPIVMLLQPTSPLRIVDDIDGALEQFIARGEQGLASVHEATDSPVLIRKIANNYLQPLLLMTSTVRRQDMPQYYRVNGSIYINTAAQVLNGVSLNDNSVPYIMPSYRSIDIDTMTDIHLVEAVIKNLETFQNDSV